MPYSGSGSPLSLLTMRSQSSQVTARSAVATVATAAIGLEGGVLRSLPPTAHVLPLGEVLSGGWSNGKQPAGDSIPPGGAGPCEDVAPLTHARGIKFREHNQSNQATAKLEPICAAPAVRHGFASTDHGCMPGTGAGNVRGSHGCFASDFALPWSACVAITVPCSGGGRLLPELMWPMSSRESELGCIAVHASKSQEGGHSLAVSALECSIMLGVPRVSDILRRKMHCHSERQKAAAPNTRANQG